MGSKWVDEAFGFMLGWNFFLYGKIYLLPIDDFLWDANYECRGFSHSMGDQCPESSLDLLE